MMSHLNAMAKEMANLRKILSMNIKKQRVLLGISQEKLAETSGISSNMIKDIEACRSWVSDNTLIKLASALEIDVYRLFVPSTMYEEEIYKNALNDFVKFMRKMKKDIDSDFEQAFETWGLKI